MATRLFNVSQVKFNGVAYGTKPGATLKLGGFEYAAEFADGEWAGVSGTPVAAEFTGSFIVKSDTDIEAIRNHEGITEFVLKDVSGVTYTSGDSIVSEPPELQAGNGITWRVIGKKCELTTSPL